jgi:DNA-binding NarL/FixJ family response regulator
VSTGRVDCPTGRSGMRLVLAEDSVLLREGLSRLLEEAGFDVVAVAGDADGALQLVDKHRPDVAVLDVRMPPTHTDEGLRAACDIRLRYPEVGILVLSQYVETSYAARLMAGGAEGVGYLLKDRVSDVSELADAVRRVGSGGCVVDPQVVSRLLGRKRPASGLDQLSERERAVLGLMAEGRSNHAVAQRLFMSEKTVESHVRTIFTKLDLALSGDDHRRVLAVLEYLRAGPQEPAGDGRPGQPTSR